MSARIRAFEAEKARLEAESQLPGVKGLTAKNMLAQLENNPLKEELNAALITAEAAVRIATRKYGGGSGASRAAGSSSERVSPTEGAIWWMNRDLEEKKKLYGARAK